MWNDNERRTDRVEWGGVSKRVWVATLLFPSLVQCSLLRRYHHLEQWITPCSWMLLSGAKRHPQINGQQARVSSKFYCCSFYSYPISYLRIVNKFKWPSLIFWLVCWPVASTIANRAWEGTEKKLHICANSDSYVCKENMWRKENSSEIKIHVYAKRQTWICTTSPSFSLNCRLLFVTKK